jgi:hypothetical protein
MVVAGGPFILHISLLEGITICPRSANRELQIRTKPLVMREQQQDQQAGALSTSSTKLHDVHRLHVPAPTQTLQTTEARVMCGVCIDALNINMGYMQSSSSSTPRRITRGACLKHLPSGS